MNFHVVTLFPEMFNSYLSESILGRAIKEKKVSVSFVNPRLFVSGKYRKVWPDGNVSLQVDDRPYGGGPGMVLKAEPIIRAVESLLKPLISNFQFSISKRRKVKIIIFSAAGKQFDSKMARDFAKKYPGAFHRKPFLGQTRFAQLLHALSHPSRHPHRLGFSFFPLCSRPLCL